MNFLKISGLVIGTGSVLGGTGAGIYYGLSKDSGAVIENNTEIHQNPESNGKVNFVGKLVFFKKSGESTSTLYEVKLLTDAEYIVEVTKFDLNKTNENTKHASVNKVIEISHLLNIENTKTELNTIFTAEITLTNAKAKVTSEEAKLKELFGNTIYESLNSALS